MNRYAAAVALGVAFLLGASAQAQTISTTAPNNGSGGIFLTLTPTASDITVTSFDTYFSSALGTPVNVQVYTRAGAYTGFTANSAGWTLSETAVGTSSGTVTLGPLPLTIPITIPAGTPTSIYLHAVTAGGGIRYTGTNAIPPVTTWSNADVQLISDVSRTGAVAFAGTQFTPRTFAGNVNYTVVPIPEPASFGLFGLVALAVLKIRRSI